MLGWVKIHRKILDWEWYKDVNTKVVFLHLILTANVTDSTYMGYTIKRGQLVTSRHQLAKECGMSDQNVRTALSHLVATKEVNQLTNQLGTIITICNYDSYNGDLDDANQPSNQDLTSHQPTYKEEVSPTPPLEEYIQERKKKKNKEKNIQEKKEEEFNDLNSLSTDKQLTHEQDLFNSSQSISTDKIKIEHKRQPPEINFKAFGEWFNKKIDDSKSNIPHIESISRERQVQLKARLKEHGGDKSVLMIVVEKAVSSSFLNGENNTGFTASFDWIFRKTIFPKILEGNYDNR